MTKASCVCTGVIQLLTLGPLRVCPVSACHQSPSRLLWPGQEGRDDVTGRRGNISEASCQLPKDAMLLQVTLARGSCQLEAEQLLIPLVMGHSKVDPWSWPASPCGAERGRQHLRGQTYSTLRSWIYENKERGETKTTLCFHPQLLFQEAY